MISKIEHLEKEIYHNERVLAATNRAAEDSKKHESLMLIFVAQAERVEDRLAKLRKELADINAVSDDEKFGYKYAKRKKNVKGKKKNAKTSKRSNKRT